MTLIVVLVMFGVQYALNVTAAFDPQVQNWRRPA